MHLEVKMPKICANDVFKGKEAIKKVPNTLLF